MSCEEGVKACYLHPHCQCQHTGHVPCPWLGMMFEWPAIEETPYYRSFSQYTILKILLTLSALQRWKSIKGHEFGVRIRVTEVSVGHGVFAMENDQYMSKLYGHGKWPPVVGAAEGRDYCTSKFLALDECKYYYMTSHLNVSDTRSSLRPFCTMWRLNACSFSTVLGEHSSQNSENISSCSEIYNPSLKLTPAVLRYNGQR